MIEASGQELYSQRIIIKFKIIQHFFQGQFNFGIIRTNAFLILTLDGGGAPKA